MTPDLNTLEPARVETLTEAGEWLPVAERDTALGIAAALARANQAIRADLDAGRALWPWRIICPDGERWELDTGETVREQRPAWRIVEAALIPAALCTSCGFIWAADEFADCPECEAGA